MKTPLVFLMALFSSILVSAQGNVGIAVPAPLNTLDIHRGTARTNTHNGGLALYVTGGAEFRSADATTGLRIGSNDIFASGANTNIDLSLAGKGSTGSITFKTNGIERARITGSGMGIGTTTPNAPLQFAAISENRKIVLFETAFNNHQYYGFGVNVNALRYQTDAPTSDHVFYSAFDASASTELMRIKGNGNVGIGTNLPNAPLQFSITAANRKIVMYEASNNDHQFIGFGQNTNSLRYQVNASTSDHVFYAGANSTTSTELLRIRGNGSVRITPSTFAFNRKLVLFQDGNDNDHQYSGFGINAGLMRYQVAALADAHVFYAAAGSSSSNELMRVKGNGRVGINGVTNPNAELHLSNTLSNRKVILNEATANDHQFSGFGVNAGILRYQVAATTNNHVFYAAANGTTSNELLRITGSGNVGIGTSTPNAPLQFSNTAANRKVVLYETSNDNHQFAGLGAEDYAMAAGNMRYQIPSLGHFHTFYAGSTSTTSTVVMQITGGGKVSIGKENPEKELDVVGSGKFTGHAQVGTYLHVGGGTIDPSKTLNVNGDAKISGTLQIGYQNVSQNFVIPGISSATNTCNCPAGFKVVGGGWKADNLDVIGSYPATNGNGWSVWAINLLPDDIAIDVYAICMKIQP